MSRHNPYLRRAPATDSRRPADPTPRMDRAKWRILHVPHGTARHFDAKGTQRVYRCSSARPRTGTGVKTYGIRLRDRKELTRGRILDGSGTIEGREGGERRSPYADSKNEQTFRSITARTYRAR